MSAPLVGSMIVCWMRPLTIMTSSAGHAPVAVRRRNEPLADRPLQGPGERDARLAVLVGGEEVDDPVDRLDGVDGVQRREHEVARLGGRQGGGDGLGVAHLADEDDVGVLPHRRAEGDEEALGVEAHLPLADGGHVVTVEHLDRVLDGDDVALAGVVDVVDHRRQGRRLARARRSRHEHEPALLVGESPDRLGEAEVVEGPGGRSHQPEDHPDRAPLAIGVHAEPPEIGDGVGEVGLPRLLELLPHALRHYRTSRSPRAPPAAGTGSSPKRIRLPLTRIRGGEPTFRCRSEPSASARR